MTIHNVPVQTLSGEPTTFGEVVKNKPALVVNVASQCGLTPQYQGLEELQREYSDRLTVVGVPCNQFKGQEPGTAEEIAEFCSSTYGVSFPLLAKTDVNGPERHPLYDVLTGTPDAEGHTGDIRWNFEKFLVDGDGEVVGRFAPLVDPADPDLRSAVAGLLAP